MSFTDISPPELMHVLSRVLDWNPSPQNWQKSMFIVGMNFQAAWASIFMTTWPIAKLSDNQSWQPVGHCMQLSSTEQHDGTSDEFEIQWTCVRGIWKGYFRVNSSHLNNCRFPFSHFQPSPLWGNKKWPPRIKVKKLEIFCNKMDLTTWSNLNAQGTEWDTFPSLRWDISIFPFSAFASLG